MCINFQKYLTFLLKDQWILQGVQNITELCLKLQKMLKISQQHNFD